MKEAHEASGAEIVTVAVRRVNLTDRSKESLLDFIPKGMTLLPEHRRLLHRRRRRAHGAARPRGRALELGQARGHRRRADALSRQRGAARGHEDAGRRKGSSSCPTPPTIRSSAASSRTPAPRRSCRSARRSARASASRTPTTSRSSSSSREGARHRRRRRRHRLGRLRRDGARRRRRADEHRHRRRAGSGADGPSDEGRRAGRTGRLPRGPHPPEALRHGLLARSRASSARSRISLSQRGLPQPAPGANRARCASTLSLGPDTPCNDFQSPCYFPPAFTKTPHIPIATFYVFPSPIRTPLAGRRACVRKGVGPRESFDPARGRRSFDVD